MKRILVVMGTRPEAIKLCPLVRELKERGGFDIRVCSTGQHGEMLDSALSAFEMRPDIALPVMKAGLGLPQMGAEILSSVDRVLKEETPGFVLVQGDTASAFFSALAAFQNKIPVGHVEAGLRTYRIRAPFPEELHRRAISLFATLHFAPTEDARAHLLKEGCDPTTVFVTGNTVIDALHFTLQKKMQCGDLSLPSGKRLLIFTAHRRENLGLPMRSSFLALRRIMERFEDVIALCPLHLNPAVRKLALEILKDTPRLRLIEPPDMITFHHLLSKAYLVITDSGGIQEEAAALGIPTLVTRNETERAEGVRAGVLRLVGTDEEKIFKEASALLKPRSLQYAQMHVPARVFGDGTASRHIADVIEHFLG